MSTCCLGHHFDIHGGGMDLQFPHHENEIAQSEGATGVPFVNLWMHNGFVRVNEEKMSKSLGNFFTVREVLKVYRPEVIRFFILNSHYRSPLNYSQETLQEAQAGLTRLYTALRGLVVTGFNPSLQGDAFGDRFRAAMDDDFNTAEAVAVLFELAREINRVKLNSPDEARMLAGRLVGLGSHLGLLETDPELFMKGAPGTLETQGLDDAAIESLISARQDAKAQKNWPEADRIRQHLAEQGIVLEDNADGTIWRRD
jgi:cysteinyl-tRNA synthetase